MSSEAESMDPLRQQANDLYWNSGDTVDQIARQLGISRSAMYSSVRPIPAGASCVHCDEPLLFTNRTARTARMALCPVCESQVALGEEMEASTESTAHGTDTTEREPTGSTDNRMAQLKEELSQVKPERAAMIGGAAALGVAVGAAAVRVLRKR